jgi:hypothetical protein
LTISVLIGVLALIAAGYCFWLMEQSAFLSGGCPVVITGFLLAIFVFIISLVTFIYRPGFDCVDHLRPPNVPQTQANHLNTGFSRY